MEGPSRIYLIYQNVLYHEDEDSGEYAQTYYEALNQDLLTQKYRRSPRKSIGGHLAKVSGVTSQYILWSGSLWYSGRSSMLKNKRIFSLVVSELMPAFSTVQLHVGKNHIN